MHELALGLRKLPYIQPSAVQTDGQQTQKPAEPGGGINSSFIGTAGPPHHKQFPSDKSSACGEKHHAELSFKEQASDTLKKAHPISKPQIEFDCHGIQQDRMRYLGTIAAYNGYVPYLAMTLLTIAAPALYQWEQSASTPNQPPIIPVTLMLTTLASLLALILSLQARDRVISLSNIATTEGHPRIPLKVRVGLYGPIVLVVLAIVSFIVGILALIRATESTTTFYCSASVSATLMVYYVAMQMLEFMARGNNCGQGLPTSQTLDPGMTSVLGIV
ncbi:hypothetical protein BD410DRAFT_844029 [Rickenella mellea]|uniref:Uncharacterized protein n=1 Tax=Rickenella mellea TaxID=50990 RepID=A0A4Y7PQ13_9AGAM|nr:hypothetical protein BD410DRAFT_844029 [Rickenella mellea]